MAAVRLALTYHVGDMHSTKLAQGSSLSERCLCSDFLQLMRQLASLH